MISIWSINKIRTEKAPPEVQRPCAEFAVIIAQEPSAFGVGPCRMYSKCTIVLLITHLYLESSRKTALAVLQRRSLMQWASSSTMRRHRT